MQERRLAAIMFTDIVGYTAMMGSDQGKAFTLLRKNREIQQQLIKRCRGELLKEMGDGILAQFNSATDAVLCAIEIQLRARNELEGQLRIGIHLGDVTFENGDVFGDGVNIASRLQSITDPAGIYISESTQKAIRGDTGIQTKYLGELNLKNVDYPVRTYCVQGEGIPAPKAAKVKKLIHRSLKERIFGSVYTYFVIISLLLLGWWVRKEFFIDKSAMPSLIFLPFENYTGTDTLDYLFAGMHDALIGEAGKISAWQVKSTTTANAYISIKKSLPEIAKELNIKYAVETSVSYINEQFCFQEKLISTYPEEKQLWVKDFYAEKSQFPNMYKSLVKEISGELNVKLNPREEILLAESGPVDSMAYDLYMKGQLYLKQMSMDALKKADRYFNMAIEIDPNWAPPYLGRVWALGYLMNMLGFLPSSSDTTNLEIYINKALEIDSNSYDAHGLKGIITMSEWNWEIAEKEFKKSLELNPNNVEHRSEYAGLLMMQRRSDEAKYHTKIALELDPLNLIMIRNYAWLLINTGEYEASIKQVEKGLTIEPDNPNLWNLLSEASEHKGDYETAVEYYIKVNYNLFEEYGVTERYEKAFREHGWQAFIEEDIKINEELFAKDDRMDLLGQGEKYETIGNLDKAMDYWEEAYKMHHPGLPGISMRLVFNKMKGNPRYIALLKKMNLPID